MAKGVLFDVAARIIEKAGHLAGQEIGQLWGVKDEIVKLGETVSSFHGQGYASGCREEGEARQHS